MVTYMQIPQLQLMIGGVELLHQTISAEIVRIENGFDSATMSVIDTKSQHYPASVGAGMTITLGVKDAADAAYTPILNGLIRFCKPQMGQQGEYLNLKCDGSGYGFGETACNQQYGTESTNTILDTISEILGDANYGLIPKHVNSILGTATASGYTYDYSNIDAIAGEGSINFYQSPFKPCLNVVNDLCDLVSAQTADANNGPHWIVDTSNNFRLKQLGATQAGWTQYYGDSQAASTLEQGIDFIDFNFEQADSEANYVLYYGVLRKPAQDYWCENHAALWGKSPQMFVTDSADHVKVGAVSAKFATALGGSWADIPSTADAGWDFSKIGSEQNPPTINFWSLLEGGCAGPIYIELATTGSDYYGRTILPIGSTTDQWNYHEYVVGPYYKPADWDFCLGSPSWTNINYFLILAGVASTCFLDDLHFEGLICRAAKDSTLIGTDKVKMKTIVDNVGKDDTMKAATDTGTIGQLVHSDLRRARTKPIMGSVTVPMIKDALPGQTFHIHAKKKADGSFSIDKDMRATTIRHMIQNSGLITQLALTDDFLNSRPRERYAQLNSILAAVRPEYQDRQATNIKASTVDIRVPILEKDYPS